jgi:hypothetical protein
MISVRTSEGVCARNGRRPVRSSGTPRRSRHGQGHFRSSIAQVVSIQTATALDVQTQLSQARSKRQCPGLGYPGRSVVGNEVETTGPSACLPRLTARSQGGCADILRPSASSQRATRFRTGDKRLRSSGGSRVAETLRIGRSGHSSIGIPSRARTRLICNNQYSAQHNCGKGARGARAVCRASQESGPLSRARYSSPASVSRRCKQVRVFLLVSATPRIAAGYVAAENTEPQSGGYRNVRLCVPAVVGRRPPTMITCTSGSKR